MSEQDQSDIEHDRATCPECGMLNVTVVTAPRKPPKMYCTNCQWDSLTGESEPLLPDGGVRGPPGRRGEGSPEWAIEGGEGLPIAYDYRSRVKNDAQIWLFTCCGCGKRLVDPPGPPAGEHTCGGDWICHRFEPKEYSAIRRFGDPRRAEEL